MLLSVNFLFFCVVVFLFIIEKCSSNGKEQFTYRTYQQINDYLENVQSQYKDKVTSFTIGHSVEGRPINGIKIASENKTENKAILVDAGIHAREWVSSVVLLHTINELLENFSNTSLTDELDWYFLPMLNPDGYIYSMDPNGDRLWRKNRSPTTISHCKGVDLNRNFGYYWGGPGSSGNPCSLSYRGPYPFSEPESLAFAQFVLSIKNQVKLYLTLHSAAQAIIYPWGFTDFVPPDWMDLEKLAMKAKKAIASVNGTNYLIGPTTYIVGVGAGGSDDWVKGSANIKYVYTMELPSLKYPRSGFHPPLEDLQMIAEESFQGIKAFAEGVL